LKDGVNERHLARSKSQSPFHAEERGSPHQSQEERTTEAATGLLRRPENKIRDKRGQVMKIYVGNLSFDVTEDELTAEFGTYGKVESVVIPADKFSGRPRGFAFVEMASKAEAEAAITGLNGKTLKDRTIVVNESRPRTDNRGGGSYGGNRRSGGYGSGGYGGGGSRGGRPGGGRQRRY
jgi:RNA recognition motif-containing protein